MRCSSFLFGLACVVSFLLMAPDADAENCLKCHDDTEVPISFAHSSNDVSCTSCHGESKAHLDKSRNPPDVVFSKHASGEATNGSCQSCHNDTAQMHWDGGAHGQADLSCAGCHQSHGTEDAVITQSGEVEVCTSCHQDLKASLNYPSRHPIREGDVTCSSCHAPHGSVADNGLKGHSPTDTCVECHEDKRGPFLFEHEPVAEDCGLCHKPHGSVLPSLLTARSPFLCQQCHMAASHPSQLADGTTLAGGSSNMLAKGCGNCHSQVHGSNHPAGARLTR